MRDLNTVSRTSRSRVDDRVIAHAVRCTPTAGYRAGGVEARTIRAACVTSLRASFVRSYDRELGRRQAGGRHRHRGLAHWVGGPQTGRVNVEFDRWFLDAVIDGDLGRVLDRSPGAHEAEREIGNGGQVIRNWVAAAGAIPETLTPRLLAYEPAMAIGLGAVDWTASEGEVR